MGSDERLARLIPLVLAVTLAGCTALDSPSLAVLHLCQAIRNQDHASYRASLDPDRHGREIPLKSPDD